MKKLLIAILVLTAFFSCSENKSNLPSGSAKEVLSNDLYGQLSEKYDSIADFEFGYAVVKKGKYGLLDYKGQEVLECLYDTIFTINSDAKVLKQNDKYGIIEYNGNKITELDNDEIKFKPDCIDTKIIAVNERKQTSDNKVKLNFDARLSVVYNFDRWYMRVFGHYNQFRYGNDVVSGRVTDWTVNASLGFRF